MANIEPWGKQDCVECDVSISGPKLRGELFEVPFFGGSALLLFCSVGDMALYNYVIIYHG